MDFCQLVVDKFLIISWFNIVGHLLEELFKLVCFMMPKAQESFWGRLGSILGPGGLESPIHERFKIFIATNHLFEFRILMNLDKLAVCARQINHLLLISILLSMFTAVWQL